jgi:hypothetical protein
LEVFMARRTGIPSIQTLAKKLCRFISRYSTVIAGLYPENAALLAALTAAAAACQVLAVELEAVREYGD